MKLKIRNLAAVCAAALIIFGCNKDYNPIPAKTSLNTIFAELRVTPQHYTVQAGTETTVTTTGGSKLHFSPTSFKDKNGNIITSGTVNISISEMLKPGDMIRNRATTMANGKPLISGGQMDINATVNGEQVYANGYDIAFKVPTGLATSPMTLFWGNNNRADSVVSWQQSDSSSPWGTVHPSYYPGTTDLYYNFSGCTNFQFINCDYFWNSPDSMRTASIVLPSSKFTDENTQVFLVLTSINCVLSNVAGIAPSSEYDKPTNTLRMISEMADHIVPDGQAYKLIVISKIDNQYYLYQSSGTVAGNLSVNADPQPVTKQQMDTALSAL